MQPAFSTSTNAFMCPTNKSLSLDRFITGKTISYTRRIHVSLSLDRYITRKSICYTQWISHSAWTDLSQGKL